jgi:hypothetical protein
MTGLHASQKPGFAPDDPYAAPTPSPTKRPVASHNGTAPLLQAPPHHQQNGAQQPASGFQPPPAQESKYITADIPQQEEVEDNNLHLDPIHQNWKSCTQVISTYSENVLTEKAGPKYKVVKVLGKGGFGVVSLCERLGPDVRPHSGASLIWRGKCTPPALLITCRVRAVLRTHARAQPRSECAWPRVQKHRRMPQRFALKELISPKVYPLGKNENIRDYLPLNEVQPLSAHAHTLSFFAMYLCYASCLM